MTTPTQLLLTRTREGLEARLYYTGKQPTPAKAKKMVAAMLAECMGVEEWEVEGVQQRDDIRERGFATLAVDTGRA